MYTLRFLVWLLVNQRSTSFLFPKPVASAPTLLHHEDLSGLRLRGGETSVRRLQRTSPIGASNEEHSTRGDNSGRSRVLPNAFNLMKALVGSGLLALPGGVAGISDSPKFLIHAVGLMLSLGAISTYTYSLYGRMVHKYQAESLGELWETIKGKDSSWVISVATLAFCFGAALSYSILIGDIFPDLAKTFGQTGFLTNRAYWILGITLTVLKPLCNLPSLLRLAPLSVVGVGAVVTTSAFLGWRCPSLNAASPYRIPDGALLASLARTTQSFDSYNKGLWSLSSTILIGMAASSYLGHFTAPSFYAAIRESSTSSTASASDMRVYNQMTVLGFGSAILLSCLVMIFGFLTFGSSSQSMILNNFSVADRGATLCRLLMAVCVMGGYPFLVQAVRKELLGLYSRFSNKKKNSPGSMEDSLLERRTTRNIILCLTGAALVMKDAGFVISISGSIMGSLLIYTFPAVLFLTQSQSTTTTTTSAGRRHRLERWLCRCLVVLGVGLSLVGGVSSTMVKYFPHLL